MEWVKRAMGKFKSPMGISCYYKISICYLVFIQVLIEINFKFLMQASFVSLSHKLKWKNLIYIFILLNTKMNFLKYVFKSNFYDTSEVVYVKYAHKFIALSSMLIIHNLYETSS